jgi:hypothetical protein
MEFEDYQPPTPPNKLLLSGHPLQIPCGLILTSDKHDKEKVIPLKTVLDTSLSRSIITTKAIQSKHQDLLGLVRLNELNKNQEVIPSGSVLLRMGSSPATVPLPTIYLRDNDDDSYDLRLGMDFLSAYEGIINLRKGELTIVADGQNAMIPFITSRGSLNIEEL